MDTSKKRISPAVISIIVVVLIAIAAGAAYAANSKNQSTTTSSETPTQTQSTATASSSDTTTSTTPATDTTSTHTYADGSYTATGSYTTPGGTESITITVTLSGNSVSDVSATGSASRGDSGEYQSRFLSGYKSQVVGKSIDSISLSRVAGSSLTSNGFNAALTKIRSEALS